VELMEIYTKTRTALAPAFGMPALGSACARPMTGAHAFGRTDVRTVAAVAALRGTTVSIERATGAFPGLHAWSPPI
jgi:hypothetical protein